MIREHHNRINEALAKIPILERLAEMKDSNKDLGLASEYLNTLADMETDVRRRKKLKQTSLLCIIAHKMTHVKSPTDENKEGYTEIEKSFQCYERYDKLEKEIYSEILLEDGKFFWNRDKQRISKLRSVEKKVVGRLDKIYKQMKQYEERL